MVALFEIFSPISHYEQSIFLWMQLYFLYRFCTQVAFYINYLSILKCASFSPQTRNVINISINYVLHVPDWYNESIHMHDQLACFMILFGIRLVW